MVSITPMPRTLRFISHPLLRVGLAIATVVGAGAVSASAMALTAEPVDATAVAPVRDDGGIAAVLSNSVGGVAASSSVGRLEGRTALIAETLSARASGTRSYGRVRVSAFRMVDESIAYAMFRFLQPDGAVRTTIGDDGWTSPKESATRIGDLVVHVTGGSDAERSALVSAVVGGIARHAPNAPIVDELPDAGRIPDSERYVSSHEMLRRFRPDLVDDVYRLEVGGADAVVADYVQQDAAPVRLLIVEYQTPQLATIAHQGVLEWFERLDPADRATRVLKREGNYLIEATGVANLEGFRSTVDAVKYDYQIKMLDGPSPAVNLDAAKEAYLTAMVLLGSVRLVGAGAVLALAIGMTLGAIVFLRRRRAAANIFSDAGGMVNLRLDGPVRTIEPERENRRLLRDRSES